MSIEVAPQPLLQSDVTSNRSGILACYVAQGRQSGKTIAAREAAVRRDFRHWLAYCDTRRWLP